ncbi:MAG: hypothetical protein ACFFB5_06535 [Promethearchaeota archaeon]
MERIKRYTIDIKVRINKNDNLFDISIQGELNMSVDGQNFKIVKPSDLKTKILDYQDFTFSVKIYDDLRIWKIDNEEFYSKWFLKETRRLKQIIMEFFISGYSNEICKKYNVEYNFLRKLTYLLAEFEDFLKALIKTNGRKGKLGKEIAQCKLRVFYHKHKRLPTSNDKELQSLIESCYHNYWTNYGITSWNDLLLSVFGELNKERNPYVGLKGLKLANKRIIAFFKEKGYKPTIRDEGMKSIQKACLQGNWREFGISSWNDLLMDIFGEVNQEINLFKGLENLKRVKGELLDFCKKYRRKPNYRDKGMETIAKACFKGYWQDFGINSWNDLLFDIFGDVNRKNNIYIGKKGFDHAKEKLLKFAEIYKRKPKKRDLGMRSIQGACHLGHWRNFGIYSWNDLLLNVFGEVNRVRKK